jgi:hypothetical protein
MRHYRQRALTAALLAALIACHAPPARVRAPEHAQTADVHQPDGSYDWHGLLIAPFGSLLRDIPLRLHEVLLFRDEAPRSGAADDAAGADADCYAAAVPAPRFVGRIPDEYLLCFKHDRLSRIQASVSLTDAQAPAVFAAACALWLKNAAAVTANATSAAVGNAAASRAAASSVERPSAAAQSPSACEGRDGDVRFSAKLAGGQGREEERDRAETPQTVMLSITLDSGLTP